GAVVLISLGDGFNVDLFSYLFGSISSVTAEDIYLIAILGAGLVLLLLLNYHQLFLVSLDEELAQVSGLKPGFYNYLLILAASVTVAVSMRIVGVMLVGALMVVPVLSAMNFKRGFGETILISVLFSLASVLLGLSFSYHFDIVSGGAIVLVSIGLYLISLSRVK
ncbi:MAG: metal ABC transporter permease, partial [SAR324 cluster bacterium]|nr:metal ABC transporter permease [SAR324 cluster bacterium]